MVKLVGSHPDYPAIELAFDPPLDEGIRLAVELLYREGIETYRCDFIPVMGGIPATAGRGIWLFKVLSSLQDVGAQTGP